jgi:hypothetical protein
MHFYRRDEEDAEMKNLTEDYLELRLQEYDFSQAAVRNPDHACVPGIHASPYAAQGLCKEKPDFVLNNFSLRSLRLCGE